jgi:hypothetical protein
LYDIYRYLANELGMSDDEIHAIHVEIKDWMKTEQRIPTVWEGPDGWHKLFLDFGIEGDPGKTCPRRIYLRRAGSTRRWNGVNVDQQATWHKRR